MSVSLVGNLLPSVEVCPPLYWKSASLFVIAARYFPLKNLTAILMLGAIGRFLKKLNL